MTIEYTLRERELMKKYEQRTGKIIGNREERYKQFTKMNELTKEKFKNGLTELVYQRLNLDNLEFLDGEDDMWKTKLFQENLEIMNQIRKNIA